MNIIFSHLKLLGIALLVHSLYRDMFILIISNFTSDKDGYYLCQIFVNNSVSQRSPYIWLYTADNSCVQQRIYFRHANPPMCAHFSTVNNRTPTTNFRSVASSTPELKTIHTYNFSFIQSITVSPNLVTSFTTEVPTTSQVAIGSEIYIAGVFGALVLILGAPVIILLIPYIHKCRRNLGKPGQLYIMLLLMITCDTQKN